MAALQLRNYDEDKVEVQRFLREYYKTESDGKKYFTYLEQLVSLRYEILVCVRRKSRIALNK